VPPFRPFRGLRYDPARVDLARVTAPPYDVIDAAARDELAERDPANAVRVDVPDPDPTAYVAARANLDAWLRDGVLRRDPPSLYVYRMTHRGDDGSERHTTGVLGALELSRPGEGGILPHEHTTPKAKSDRLALLQATQANLSAVWALSPAAGLTGLLPTDGEPAARWSDDGVDHTLWVINDPAQMAAISDAIGTAPVVIADGHHRYETSLTYRDEQAALPSPDAPGAGSVLAYVVELVDDELEVLPIHRLVTGLPTGLDLVDALGPWFEVEPIADAVASGATAGEVAARLASEKGLVLVTPDGAWRLRARPDQDAAGADLDSRRFDDAIAGLGVGELSYQHGVAEAVGAVLDGRAQAAALLRPASVAQIVAIAHGGERMPPKTTFFWPKPRTGVVFRLLDE
jgi:uncharacterized protein (DUF1015 family)